MFTHSAAALVVALIVAQPHAEDLEQLSALGYVGSSDASTNLDQVGVVRIDRARMLPGYSLYANSERCTAELVSHEGVVVRTWKGAADCKRWANVLLTPARELLVVTRGKLGAALVKLSWQGKLVWQKSLPVHHDVELAPDGRIFMLTERARVPRGFAGKVLDNYVEVLSPAGELLETCSLFDLILRDGRLLAGVRPRGGEALDLLHANTVSYVPKGALKAAGVSEDEHVLVTLRHRDAVIAIEWRTKRIDWVYGPGVLDGPHDAQVLDSGHVVVFDNGRKRQWSRVIEIEPWNARIAWEFRPSLQRDFFTSSRGSVQVLENGNVLLTVSDLGRAIEVTRHKEIVWEYWNPHIDKNKRRSTFEQVKRYGEGMVTR